MNKTILFFIVNNFPKNILLFSKNFYIIYIEDKKGEKNYERINGYAL